MKTAVDYMFEQLEEKGLIFLTTKTNEMTISISASDYLDIKRLAKEMEKQQIINAINDVSENNVKYANKILSSLSGIQGELFMHNDKLAKQYYNETYGSKGSETKQ